MSEQNISQTQQKGTEVYKCPSCGANLTFSPLTQKLSCAHCGGEFDFNIVHDVVPVDYATGERPKEDWSEEAVVFRCENCGAKEILSRTEMAKVCPFCGTTNIVETEELAGIKPTAIIPFLFAEEEAKRYFIKWVRKRWFIPNKLKKEASTNAISGVYSPSWIFNCNSESTYVGRLGEHYTVTVGSGKNARTETHTRWFRVSGSWNRSFENYIIEASPHLTPVILDKLRPFRLEQGAKYDKRFLAGFSASHYDKDLDTSWFEARDGMKNTIRQEIINHYHADEVGELKVDAIFSAVNFQYMLLPVWVCNYTYKSKLFNFYVNGSSGQVTGKVPRSAPKIIAFTLGMIALVVLLCFLFNLFFPSA